ncbi:hypothetical protein NDU88_006436 [Pleurodeles waltl]|uniref:Cadherin domain-containing protein n=1 Tax=Pleurodeles waltl TaxID=8319 RepID=A0AAV7PL09_PLEWA|nr:hypothetical protein NDU88_006436 [Pleurodeles waltl]
MGFAVRRWFLPWISVFTCSLLWCRGRAEGPIRYTALEESEAGAEVGNVARDLGVDVRDLHLRNVRLTYESDVQYFTVSMESGTLLTKEILDREALCGSIGVCVMNLEVVMDNPLEFHRLEIEIVDINDNAPFFPTSETRFTITELTLPGTHFPLRRANDPDVGTNSQCSYRLSRSDFFTLNTKVSDYKSASVDLVLNKPLDREQQAVHELTLTAVDGGTPTRSGTSHITIRVLDANDNPPVFDKDGYRISVLENTAAGTVLMKLNATDIDEGANGEIVYSFGSHEFLEVRKMFSVDTENGEIRAVGYLDYEESNVYELHVQAQDKAPLPMTAHSKVLVEIIDVNDNAPEIRVTSFSSPVKEDAQPGQVIALFTVTDKDSGVNAQVRCQIGNELPFVINSKYQNFYSLSVKKPLDREATSMYNVTVLATDGGSPSLSTMKTIVVSVSDVNDNAPAFSELSYVTSVPENNVPGSHVLQVLALDPDTGDNARVRYSLIENSVDTVSILSLFSVHPETGVISALQPFDHEKFQVVQFWIEAKDCGSPTMSGIANMTVFIQDANDNPPTIIQTGSRSAGSGDVLVPRSSNAGHIVSKIRAVDSDSGHNAWLSYEFIDSTMGVLFKIGLHTGEISLRHPLGESYLERRELFILVKDHGTPPLSATATLTISLVETAPEVISDYKHVDKKDGYLTNLNSYLIISIAFISGIFIFCIILFVALRYLEVRNEYGMKEKTELCPDGEGNWLYSQTQQDSSYLTAQPAHCDNGTLKSNPPHEGWTHVIFNGGKPGDLIQRYSITVGNNSQAPSEVRE